MLTTAERYGQINQKVSIEFGNMKVIDDFSTGASVE